MQALIECVPNFSEGNDLSIIRQIADEIESITGVKLLNIDPGKATNRTVVTFVGPPEAVVNAAFLAIKKAGQLIDMSKQKGEHPRMGATDVCPLIPINGITLEETAQWAKKLGERVGNELHIPVYLYEASQPDTSRNNLSIIRAGEYEGFFNKIKLPEWTPDFGPKDFDAKRGATVIGARDYLIAYNINLNTSSVKLASAIAGKVRTSGYTIFQNGIKTKMLGNLKALKAMGWYIKEYGVAQVSMNLTNIKETPIHIAFEEVCAKANDIGIRVTGSELIGLIPLQCMIDAGNYFLQKQNFAETLSEHDIIQIAIKTMGLGELSPFNPEERIIEYVLKNKTS